MRLSREIQVRIGFERRLTAVIDELNHRVKNILAVIQSIVTRTLRHGSDIDVARELLIGRIHAMSNVVSLLSESQWQGVKLKGLFEARAIPHAERIAVDGPDIAVSARAAQSLSLLFFELASHSDEGLSLVGKHPHIVAHWEVTGEEPDAIFHFRWEEFNTCAATRRADSDFGLILLDRVAPEALGGVSKRYFTDVSYVYELTAPMETVVDMTERDRTEQFAMPPRRAEVTRGIIVPRHASVSRDPHIEIAKIPRGARPHPEVRSRRPSRNDAIAGRASSPPLPPITARTVSSGPKSSAPST